MKWTKNGNSISVRESSRVPDGYMRRGILSEGITIRIATIPDRTDTSLSIEDEIVLDNPVEVYGHSGGPTILCDDTAVYLLDTSSKEVLAIWDEPWEPKDNAELLEEYPDLTDTDSLFDNEAKLILHK